MVVLLIVLLVLLLGTTSSTITTMSTVLIARFVAETYYGVNATFNCNLCNASTAGTKYKRATSYIAKVSKLSKATLVTYQVIVGLAVCGQSARVKSIHPWHSNNEPGGGLSSRELGRVRFGWCPGVSRNGAFLPGIVGGTPKVSCTWHGTAGRCHSLPGLTPQSTTTLE
jgi:hypothetical protein